jgi:hypothetical protein
MFFVLLPGYVAEDSYDYLTKFSSTLTSDFANSAPSLREDDGISGP